MRNPRTWTMTDDSDPLALHPATFKVISLADFEAFKADYDRFHEALSFYANEDTWRNAECDRLNAEGGFFPYGIEDCPISTDGGKIASEALTLTSAKDAKSGDIGGDQR